LTIFFRKKISRSRSQVSKLYMGMVHTTMTLVYKKNLFERCLRFFSWFRAIWPRWIQKWHPFFWIRSSFCANSI